MHCCMGRFTPSRIGFVEPGQGTVEYGADPAGRAGDGRVIKRDKVFQGPTRQEEPRRRTSEQIEAVVEPDAAGTGLNATVLIAAAGVGRDGAGGNAHREIGMCWRSSMSLLVAVVDQGRG